MARHSSSSGRWNVELNSQLRQSDSYEICSEGQLVTFTLATHFTNFSITTWISISHCWLCMYVQARPR